MRYSLTLLSLFAEIKRMQNRIYCGAKIIMNNLFSGRCGRIEYLLQILFNTILLSGMAPLVFLFEPFGLIFVIIIYPLLILLFFSSTIKRLHDIDFSGWFSILLFVPFLNLVFILYLLLKSGNPSINKYNTPQPKKLNLKIVKKLEKITFGEMLKMAQKRIKNQLETRIASPTKQVKERQVF